MNRSCLPLLTKNPKTTLIINMKYWTVQPGDAFEDAAFKPWF
jgi:hypothetical protein